MHELLHSHKQTKCRIFQGFFFAISASFIYLVFQIRMKKMKYEMVYDKMSTFYLILSVDSRCSDLCFLGIDSISQCRGRSVIAGGEEHEFWPSLSEQVSVHIHRQFRIERKGFRPLHQLLDYFVAWKYDNRSYCDWIKFSMIIFH